MRRHAVRAGLVLAALVAAGPAQADIPDLFIIVSAITGSAAVAETVVAVTGFISAYATVAFAAYQIYGSIDARRKARNAAAQAQAAYNASLADRNITALTADPPWQVIYGAAVVGGAIVGIFTSDKQGTRSDGSSYTKPDAYKHLVVVLAAHEIQAVDDVLIEGVSVGTLVGGWAASGDLAVTRTVHREVIIAPAAAMTFPAAVTVLSAYDTELSAYVDTGYGNPGYAYVNGSYALSAGNTVVTNTGTSAISVTLTYSETTGSVHVETFLGTSAQTADAWLMAQVPAQWTSNDRLRGLAGCVVTLDLEDTRFQGGPPQLSFKVRGKKLYDPRTGTTAYSNNPALVVRDFLLAPWGYECAAGDVDDTSVIAAANACDANTPFTEGTTTTYGPLYTCNGAFTTDADRDSTLNDLCDSMAGSAIYGAQWRVLAGGWTATVMDLGDADLHGQIEIVQAGAGMDDIFNGVRGSFIPAGSGVVSEFDPYQNSTYVTADGRELWTNVNLPWTDSRARCRNLSRIQVERVRDGQVIRYPAKLKAWPLEVGDRVRVTSAEYGWTTKTFQVTDWQFGLSAPVTLLLQEDSAGAYDLADAANVDPNQNTGLPDPWVVAALTGVAAASGDDTLLLLGDGTVQPRIRVTWDAITGAYLAAGPGQVEVAWRRPLQDAANVWQKIAVTGGDTGAWIVGPGNGDAVTIGVTAINSLGVRGTTVYVQHQVVSKRQAPGDVQGFAMTPVAGGLRFQWQRNQSATTTELHWEAVWNDATAPAWRGKATEWFVPWPPDGTYTLLAKHRDDSGNASANAVAAQFTKTGTLLTNYSVNWYSADGEVVTWYAGPVPTYWLTAGPVDIAILTDNLGDEAATSVFEATDGGPYTTVAGVAPTWAIVAFTFDADYRQIHHVTADLSYVNSSGAAQLVNVTVIGAIDDGIWGNYGNFANVQVTVPAGATWSQRVTISKEITHPFTLRAGVSVQEWLGTPHITVATIVCRVEQVKR